MAALQTGWKQLLFFDKIDCLDADKDDRDQNEGRVREQAQSISKAPLDEQSENLNLILSKPILCSTNAYVGDQKGNKTQKTYSTCSTGIPITIPISLHSTQTV